MGLKPESTGHNYNKVEKMWTNFSDNTGGLPKMNNKEKMISIVQVVRS